MFRENVLIALTILITILALSFVILLTVYLQLHEMEERLKRFEKKQQELMQEQEEANSTSSSPFFDTREDDGLPKSLNEWYKRNEMIFNNFGGAHYKDPFNSPPKPTTTSTTTTPEPIPTYFGISDDVGHPEPEDTIRFPFHFFGSSGHLTIEIPDSDNFTDYGNEKIIKEVLKRLRIYYENRKVQELNSRMRYFNGLPGEPLGFFYPFNMKHEKYIWFEKPILQRIAPEAVLRPLPHTVINVSEGRRRRRKRAIRNNRLN